MLDSLEYGIMVRANLYELERRKGSKARLNEIDTETASFIEDIITNQADSTKWFEKYMMYCKAMEEGRR